LSTIAQASVSAHHQRVAEALAHHERIPVIVQVLVGALFGHDHALCEHLRRVASLSVSVALRCGIREPHVSTIEWAAWLHHVTVADNGGHMRTVDRRNSVIPEHYATAVQTLSASINLVDASRRQGSASLTARILAVCDRYDQLTHLGPCPISESDAFDILVGEQGTDNAVLDALRGLPAAARGSFGASSYSFS